MTDDDPIQSPQESAVRYWDRVAGTKTFTHELDHGLFERIVPATAHVVDLGCGYGRVLADLRSRGRTAGAVGFDSSLAMVERGRREHPGLDLRHFVGARLPLEGGAVDAVLLIAVLTCVPGDADQRALVAEAGRVLRPGGTLWVTDLWLQSDERNVRRYARNRPPGGPFQYGVFEHGEGAVFRHHDPEWIEALFADWEPATLDNTRFQTMNGHPADGFRLMVRKR